jgi:hypothetical protein
MPSRTARPVATTKPQSKAALAQRSGRRMGNRTGNRTAPQAKSEVAAPSEPSRTTRAGARTTRAPKDLIPTPSRGVLLARRAAGAKAKHLLPFTNPLVEVAESGIHGLGVFAARRLRKGALIGTMEGRRTQRNNDHVLWIEDDDGAVWGLEPWNELRFTNHSDTPNAVFYGPELYALRAIAPGEEITFDYNGDVDPDAR